MQLFSIRAVATALVLSVLAACGAAENGFGAPAPVDAEAIDAGEAADQSSDMAADMTGDMVNDAAPATSLADAFAWPAASSYVLISTSKGDMTVELYADKAPLAVANFLQYAADGHYDGTVFHRVVEKFVIQGGGYTQTYEERPARAPIAYEGDNGLPNFRSTLSAARGKNPNSATSQWLVNLRDNQERLDHVAGDAGPRYGYAVFGRVIRGMDVADAIGLLPTGPAGPFAEEVPILPVIVTRVEPLASPPLD